MENQKLGNQLNLALDATMREREASMELNTGYDAAGQRWDLIIRYTGDIRALSGARIFLTPLLGNYAIVNLPEDAIDAFSGLPQVTYVEKPKRLFFASDVGRVVSCINSVQNQPPGLSGRGVLVACVDSGVDYSHPDFRNPDGTTRILCLWDQTIEGNPPEGYRIGTEYTREQINEALAQEDLEQRYARVPSRDNSGHGTAVLGIAAGNGRTSQGIYRGVAYESDLLVVKLGRPQENGFPRTTELMQGIDYAVRQAMAWEMPLALNLSFGNSYGSHSGQSLLETYLDTAADRGRTVVCVGTGNEGSRALHTSGVVREGEDTLIEFGIGNFEPTVNLQLWKSYQDRMEIYLIHPSGNRIGPLEQIQEAQRFRIQGTELLVYYGMPGPYSRSQEIYMEFLPRDLYVDSGVWRLLLVPRRILSGQYHLWLPGGNVLGEATRFYQPTPDLTLTIPSTAQRVISTGAYDPVRQTYADFSGRGYTREIIQIKPDLAAPGVNITTTQAGGGYTSLTGTSFAAPFVTGAAALLMEWGILRGNDPYLYGEKVKEYLINGARQLPVEPEYPNPRLGWGVLCVKDSLPTG